MRWGSAARYLLIWCLLLLFLWISSPLAVASGLMLPQVDDGKNDISGWWVSEKLDGVRGYWDGKRMWSKNGQLFEPPFAFVSRLPEFALEGELWGGRGTFEQTASIVQKAQPHEGWLQLRFAIFDVPEATGPFSERIDRAIEWFASHPSEYAFVIPQQPIVDREQMQRELERVMELGGEGLIIRNPKALYKTGRNSEILKVKKYADAEAVVVGHTPGQGENLGRLGSLLVELEDGTRFKIGTGFSAAQRDNPPPVGAVVTFKYYGFYQSGIPKFPSFLRIRGDIGL